MQQFSRKGPNADRIVRQSTGGKLERTAGYARGDGRAPRGSPPGNERSVIWRDDHPIQKTRHGDRSSGVAGKQHRCSIFRTWQPVRSLVAALSLRPRELFHRQHPTVASMAHRFAAASIRVLSCQKQKKSPDHQKMIRGCPCLSSSRCHPPDPRGETVTFQAGILTPGSSLRRVFPTRGQ